jgi:hypothetical protein
MFTGPETFYSGVASTDMRSYQYHAVEMTSTFDKYDLAAAKGGKFILANNPNAGEHAQLVRRGLTMVRVGGAVSRNDLVTSAATGYAVRVTSSVAQNVLGTIMADAASGMYAPLDLDWFRVSSIA